MKITDPDALLPDFEPGADVRVLVPQDVRFDPLRKQLADIGVPVVEVPYLIEQETVRTRGTDGWLTVDTTECRLARPAPRQFSTLDGSATAAAKQAFEEMWEAHQGAGVENWTPTRVTALIPPDWAEFLPYETFNPAQSQAVLEVLADDRNLVVVAPTGAGKTVVGMVAALRTVVGQGRKAAWLVPQRSLTDELDRELETWRGRGMKVERLSGEFSIDIDRVRRADLWVATTEKFEAMCRAASLRDALAEVGCVIVDEIHLLGDPERGPVLEALLARMRGEDGAARIIGLSATVSNAEQIAEWLRARLVRVAWRPSALTWQLPTIAASADWGLVEAARTRLTAALASMITDDGGSVLVFCGSKRNVRRTALIIAGARGADIHGVHPDDFDQLHRTCGSVKVGLHYKGWEHKLEAERAFRNREIDVLVATTTVAAGVNLPARGVIVQDTSVGLGPIDVATVQQMFGRAGRVGAGEARGWAFLVVDDTERADWQARLLAGNTVHSRIESCAADHVLAEIVQHRITSLGQAERWWVQTLAHHQGSRSLDPLRSAVRFLVDAGFAEREVPLLDGTSGLKATELGLLTARIMVPAAVGQCLRAALAETRMPRSADEAEALIINLVSTLVPKLAQASTSEDAKPAVLELLRANRIADLAGRTSYQPGDLARAALLTVANTPVVFHRSARIIAGVPYASMYPVLEEAPRYLHWLAAQGLLGTVAPWVAVVAADLAKRVRWRRCQPTRGAGRLLWMCEQMATPVHADEVVPELWRAARARDVRSPDWTTTSMPSRCRLDATEYAKLLRDRSSGVVIVDEDSETVAFGVTGAVLATWSGCEHRLTPMQRGRASVSNEALPRNHRGAAVFTWRGDYRAIGWLGVYNGIGSDLS